MLNWIVALVFVALGLFLVEIFFVPGLGFAGLIGFIVLCTATYIASSVLGASTAALIFFGTLSIVALAFFVFLRSPIEGFLVLKSQLKTMVSQGSPFRNGLTGISTTPLHPSGKAMFRIGSRSVIADVVTNGEFLEDEIPVEIVRVEGSRILVRERV